MERREEEITGAKGSRGEYVNSRQMLQYKVSDCQGRHIQVPIQGFVKYIPKVWVSFADVK